MDFAKITDEKEKTEIINDMIKINDYKLYTIKNKAFNSEIQMFIKEIIDKYRYKIEVANFYNSPNGKDNIDCNQYATLCNLEQMIVQYVSIKYIKEKGGNEDE